MTVLEAHANAVETAPLAGHFGSVEPFAARERRRSIGQDRITRSIDVSVAFAALLLLTIPLGLVAVLVAITSRGPVVFRQQRVGRGGEHFEVLKFRTMKAGTAFELRSSAAQWDEFKNNDFKLASSDARITRVGRVLRLTSVDEIPQLVNVLRGEMSLVGIRPLVPLEYDERPAADRMLYQQRRPGLTGRWQVEGRSCVATPDRLRLDRTYIEQWSLREDLLILLRTPAALCRTGETR